MDDTLRIILESAKQCPAVSLSGAVFADRAFISDVHARFCALTGDTCSLSEFKAYILANRATLTLTRCDLVGAFSAATVRASETDVVIGGRTLATVTFFAL